MSRSNVYSEMRGSLTDDLVVSDQEDNVQEEIEVDEDKPEEVQQSGTSTENTSLHVESTVRDPCKHCSWVEDVFVNPCAICYIYHGVTTNLVYHGDQHDSCECEFCNLRRDWLKILTRGRDEEIIDLVCRMKHVEDSLDDCQAAFTKILHVDLREMETALDTAVKENYENRRNRMDEENEENEQPPVRRRRLE